MSPVWNGVSDPWAPQITAEDVPNLMQEFDAELVKVSHMLQALRSLCGVSVSGPVEALVQQVTEVEHRLLQGVEALQAQSDQARAEVGVLNSVIREAGSLVGLPRMVEKHAEQHKFSTRPPAPPSIVDAVREHVLLSEKQVNTITGKLEEHRQAAHAESMVYATHLDRLVKRGAIHQAECSRVQNAAATAYMDVLRVQS